MTAPVVLEAVADGRLGGGTTHVLQLIATLKAQLGAEVHLASEAGSPALAEAAAQGAVTHGLPFFASRLDPRPWRGLRRLVRALKPAVIHAHGARACLPLTTAAAGTPLLYSVHGYHFVGKKGLVRRLALLAERRCSARAAVTIFVAGHDRAVAEQAGILARCRAHRVIPNGIDLAGLPAAGGGDGRTIAYLGRLSAEKNPLLAVDVLARLQAAGFHLVVIGDGPLRERVREQAAALGVAGRVELRGALPRPEALAALARADVLLVPSLWEGLPLAPLEAMAIGVPVVAHAAGGLVEVVEDGRSGVLIDGLAPDPYAAAVLRLMEEPERRRCMVEAARRRVAERFSWRGAAQAYVDLYREVLAPA